MKVGVRLTAELINLAHYWHKENDSEIFKFLTQTQLTIWFFAFLVKPLAIGFIFMTNIKVFSPVGTEMPIYFSGNIVYIFSFFGLLLTSIKVLLFHQSVSDIKWVADFIFGMQDRELTDDRFDRLREQVLIVPVSNE